VKRPKLAIIFCVIMVLVLMASAFACNGDKTTTPSGGDSKYGGTMTIIFPYMGASLGWPATASGGYNMWQQFSLESLVIQNEDGSFTPRLATSWDIADDKSSITFHLREGVKFHDGSALTAEVVKWNYEALKAAAKTTTVYWDSFEVLNTYTLKVNLNAFTNWSLTDFGFTASNYIVSKEAYEKNGEDWSRNNMVGTGPFKQVDWEQDDHITFEKNTDYWNEGKPYLDKINALCVVDAMTQQTTFISGGADVLQSEGDKKVADLAAQGYTYYARPVGVTGLFPDSKNDDSPLSNIKVREAIEYAIDKETLAKTLAGGMMTPAYLMAYKGQSAYDPSLTRKYDPDKAKQLLIEAGYPNGVEFEIVPIPVAMFTDQGTAIQAQLATVGINVTTTGITDAKFYEYYAGEYHNAAILSAVSGGVPNVIQSLSLFFNPEYTSYRSVWRSDAYIAAFNAAKDTEELETDKAQAVMKAIYDDELIIPLFESQEAWVIQSNVKGLFDYWPAGLQMIAPENAWLEK
jgi:peptide/nickel transport system substrate-binding protein